MSTKAQIAVACGSPGGATAELAIFIEEMTGERPKPVRLMDLAGPNETIQILLSHEGWMLVVKAVAAVYGAELVKEAAKATWKSVAPKLTKAADGAHGALKQLVRAIAQALHAKAPVILGFPRTPVGGRRHIGVEILDDDPEEISRVISLLAEHGEEIEERLDEWDRLRLNQRNISYDENSDCSVRLWVTDEGSIQLRATVSDDSYAVKEVVVYELNCDLRADA